jgi:hypothetical protein
MEKKGSQLGHNPAHLAPGFSTMKFIPVLMAGPEQTKQQQ